MFNTKILKTTLSDITIVDKVNLVIYSINTNGLHPFMTVHLVKDYNTGLLNCPTIPYYENNTITEPECLAVVNKLFTNYAKYINSINYSGYINGNQLYVFYEINWTTYEAEHIDEYSLIFPVIMDEIINKHSIYNIHINPHVILFFISNPDIVYLIDKYNNPLEYPIVTYRADPTNKIQFIAMFGASKKMDGKFGPYYYFKSYNQLMSDLKTKRHQDPLIASNSYGILRCGIFSENMTLYPNEFTESNINTLYYNGEYIIKTLDHHIPLTYNYVNYNIHNI